MEQALSPQTTPLPDHLMAPLLAAGHLVEQDTIRPLTGGRTNHVWRVVRNCGDLVLKAYRGDTGNLLFPNSFLCEIAALQALEDSGDVPKLRAFGTSDNTSWVLYEHLEGPLWHNDPAPVAHLLARIHATTPFSGLRHGPNGSQDIARQTLGILAACQSPKSRLLAARAPTGQVAPLDRPRLIHADPVPANIVMRETGPALIDWQCPALGDPSEDLAFFTSPAMQLLYRGSALTRQETGTFLSAYPDPSIARRYQALKPWYHWRMAAYCLWKIERGNADYERGLQSEMESLAAYSKTE